MGNCLLCGAGVWYVGLFNADCTNAGCVNYREPPAPPKMIYGSWGWARKHQNEGWRIEWKLDGDWTPLDERLENDPSDSENEPYVYRLRQDWYEHGSRHARGTAEWAMDQKACGRHLYFNGRDYEIIP